jgi:hypothetical protein
MTALAPEADLVCPDCGSMMLRRTSNKFPGHPFFYGCSQYPICNATHGAHPNGAPFGIPANAATKAKRVEAHEVFDRLWYRSTRMSRGAAYDWLAAKLGMDAVHMGSADIALCDRVIMVCTVEAMRLATINDGDYTLLTNDVAGMDASELLEYVPDPDPKG